MKAFVDGVRARINSNSKFRPSANPSSEHLPSVKA